MIVNRRSLVPSENGEQVMLNDTGYLDPEELDANHTYHFNPINIRFDKLSEIKLLFPYV